MPNQDPVAACGKFCYVVQKSQWYHNKDGSLEPWNVSYIIHAFSSKDDAKAYVERDAQIAHPQTAMSWDTSEVRPARFGGYEDAYYGGYEEAGMHYGLKYELIFVPLA